LKSLKHSFTRWRNGKGDEVEGRTPKKRLSGGRGGLQGGGLRPPSEKRGAVHQPPPKRRKEAKRSALRKTVSI